MKLKQSLLALLATGTVVSAAHADMTLISNDKGSLDFYSIIDVAMVTQDHSLSISPSMPMDIFPYQAQPIGPTHSVSGLIGGGLSDSRIGFKGALNMDSTAKAIFDLETGFDPVSGQINSAAAAIAANPIALKPGSLQTNGGTAFTRGAGFGLNSENADSSLNGQLFNRAAWFGLTDQRWGQVTVGLQFNPMKEEFMAYDPVKSDSFSPFGESGTIGGGGGVSEDARMENSVRYQYHSNGYVFDAAYQFGNNTSSNGVIGGSGVGDAYALRIGYDDSRFGIEASYNNFTDTLKAVNAVNPAMAGLSAGTTLTYGNQLFGYAPGEIALAELNTEAFLLAVKYTGFTDLNLSAGFESFTDSHASDNVSISSIWNTPVQYVFQPYGVGQSQTTNIWFAGGDYNLTPRWNLALGYYNVDQGNTTGTSNSSGTVEIFSGVLSYHLYKNADLYLAATTNNFSGPAFTGDWSSVTAYGLGGRVKF